MSRSKCDHIKRLKILTSDYIILDAFHFTWYFLRKGYLENVLFQLIFRFISILVSLGCYET
jgi:hypothetical protein